METPAQPPVVSPTQPQLYQHITDAAQAAPPPKPSAPPAKPPRNYTLWLFIAGIVIFIIVVSLALIVGSSIFLSLLKPPAQPQPEPAAPVIMVTPKIESKFASDSAVLQIRDSAKSLQTDIDSVDLVEPELSPPSLDLNIRITTN